MESLYEMVKKAASAGCDVLIDFKKRSLSIDKRTIVVNGVVNVDSGKEKMSLESTLGEIERLYGIFRHSIPSEMSQKRRKFYFSALCLDDLTEEDMLFGERRENARAELETFILLSIIDGSLYWDENIMGEWFWKSKKEKNLVLLKEWIS